MPSTTTTSGDTTTTTASSGLPSDAFEFGPAAGDRLAVVGVAHDDVLNLRAAPGADQAIVAGIPPLYITLVAVGETRQLPRSMWIEVAYDGLSGWVNLRYIAYLGATNDRTAEILTTLGETPSAENMLELEWIVAESLSPDGVLPNLVVVAAPTGGDLDEVTYDLTGQEDDSVMGARIHVFGQPTDAGFSLDSVGVTLMCARGVDGDGHCI